MQADDKISVAIFTGFYAGGNLSSDGKQSLPRRTFRSSSGPMDLVRHLANYDTCDEYLKNVT